MSYDDFVKTTDKSNHGLQFYLDGMNEENGEISGIFKRMRRGDYGDEIKNMFIDFDHQLTKVVINNEDIRTDLLKEIGDRHWYTTRFLQEIKASWEYVEMLNQNKLIKREETGTILGEGDNREDEVS